MRQSRYVREAGTGAGTFPFSHYRFRSGGGVVKHAHSQWFNVLNCQSGTQSALRLGVRWWP